MRTLTRALPALALLVFVAAQAPSAPLSGEAEKAAARAVPCTLAVLQNGKVIGAAVAVGPHEVLTCRHCVGAAKSVRLRLQDGTELDAQVVAAELNLDLALLKVQAKLPSHLPLADRTPGPGADVLAVGSPLGEYAWSVSRGVISHPDRDITLENAVTLRHVLQTDAAINGGNSGGPLVNLKGELVGVVCARRTDAQLIGFAVGTETVRAFLKANKVALGKKTDKEK